MTLDTYLAEAERRWQERSQGCGLAAMKAWYLGECERKWKEEQVIQVTERVVTEYRCRCKFCPHRGPVGYSEEDAIEKAEDAGWDGPECCPDCVARFDREQAANHQ